ncbi:MAG: metallophosphoesterase family protein [Actinomycetota bacterium]|nr:metallophosphoesterase family protein [Actinomycetota bacterium]MDQ6945643.1 metallophosphoesterase family protein [Actinomycetota bacterium]
MNDARGSVIDPAEGGLSRRGFLMGGMGLGILAGASALGLEFWFDSGLASADTSGTYPLPSTTAPEQIHLQWGAHPAHEVVVSWGSAGGVPQPDASVAFADRPITAANPGKAAPITVRTFTDGINTQTTYYYHASLAGLKPSTRYYYEISDGATPRSVIGSSFTTAPVGRAPFSFTSYGDLATPTGHLNSSGHTWALSSDNAFYAVGAVEAAAPLFHLLNGDLCYANVNSNNQPGVWRDFGNNVQRSAASRPWMPCLGNHEQEFGADNQDGSANATGNGGWNGPYGYGNFQTRYALPDNEVPGYAGNFYGFQVGTVLFIALDADDVIYQDGGSFALAPLNQANPFPPANPNISIAAGFSTYNREYTGTLTSGPNDTVVASPGAGGNRQTKWLEGELKRARKVGSTVDMIVVQMHQCALSSTSAGNGSDLGLRQTWLPLFDRYGVDLVLSGHEHNYERSLPVRGYDAGYEAKVVFPNPGQAPAGTPVQTRRPTVVAGAGPLADPADPTIPAFDTSKGTVYLVLGGGGTDGPSNRYGFDGADNLPQAKVITERNLIYRNSAGTWMKNPADSVEDAPWSARTDTTDAYGIASFSVDPGAGPGQTTILMTYSHAPQAGGNPSTGNTGFVGATTYSTYEKVLFGHNLPQVPFGGPPAATPELPMPAVAVGAAALAVGGGALYLHQRDHGDNDSSSAEADA